MCRGTSPSAGTGSSMSSEDDSFPFIHEESELFFGKRICSSTVSRLRCSSRCFTDTRSFWSCSGSPLYVDTFSCSRGTSGWLQSVRDREKFWFWFWFPYSAAEAERRPEDFRKVFKGNGESAFSQSDAHCAVTGQTCRETLSSADHHGNHGNHGNQPMWKLFTPLARTICFRFTSETNC